MDVIIYDSNLTKEDVRNNPVRTACRSVVFYDGKILTVYEEKWDMSTLPGGGLEVHETPEQCVIRETKEETGVIVQNPVQMVRVIEHFEKESFVSIYFRCDYVATTTETSFTKQEIDVHLRTRWLVVEEFLEILSTNMTLFKYGSNIHNREFLGLVNSL